MRKSEHSAGHRGVGFSVFTAIVVLIAMVKLSTAIAQTQTFSDPVGFLH